jgi:hypothetical protein
MALLDGLDGVPWGELSHAYGPATDVPDLLRTLVDPERAPPGIRKAAEREDKTIREEVIWRLYGNVFHQGTVWQVTPHVIPFFVEILADGPRDAELQRFVLEYLHHLALGYPQDIYPELVDPATHFAAADAPRENAEDPIDPAIMAGYARDCYRGVEAALPVIARFATDEAPTVALEAIAVLASFRSEVSIATLRRVVEQQEGRRLAVALVALAQLDPAATVPRARELLGDRDRFTAVHAAAALVLADPDHVPEAAVQVLTQPLDDLVEEPSPMTDSVGKLVSACLARLPARHVERVVRAIAGSLASSNAMTNLASTSSLLELVLAEGAPSEASELTSLQRTALELIVEHGAFDADGIEFGNYSLLLFDFGLPGSRDKLKAWLAGT